MLNFDTPKMPSMLNKNATFAARKNNKMILNTEVKRRRTFAIISHPDAGKTTLTEKLLLFGGAIHVAGAVKSNKIKKGATSDFMEIERQRGISVATSVMGFEYRGIKINILDTPGHEDFAEDTYRTLTAVDSVIIVIDCAKGVETQTRKLMNVCRMRNTPVIVFINKMDRNGKDPFDLLDEIEEELNIKVRPLSWPISMGPTFQGVYNMFEQKLNLFFPEDKQTLTDDVIEIDDINSELLDHNIGSYAKTLRDDLELVNGVYPNFNLNTYLSGEVAPVFFGSALNNFGVQELLNCFIEIAPYPKDTITETREVSPFEEELSGFIFKIHANMDPNHRDRIAFLKICSGIFERNKPYLHVRSDKKIKFSSPTAFMADKKSIVDMAFPGDIVGLHDTGTFRIGDTLTQGEHIKFKGIPSFSPEMFRYIENADPMKFKQLAKGVDQLMDEGVAQLFTSKANGRKIIGTVGALQFDVIQYRLEHEYGALCRYEPINLFKACWIESNNIEQLKDFRVRKYANLAFDKHGREVFLAESPYALQMAQDKFTEIKFHFTTEF
jgi:peptide chain release factor 3